MLISLQHKDSLDVYKNNIEPIKAVIQALKTTASSILLLELFPTRAAFHAQLTNCRVDRVTTTNCCQLQELSRATPKRRPNRDVNINNCRNNTAQPTTTISRRKATYDRHTQHNRRRHPCARKNRAALGLSPEGVVELVPVGFIPVEFIFSSPRAARLFLFNQNPITC